MELGCMCFQQRFKQRKRKFVEEEEGLEVKMKMRKNVNLLLRMMVAMFPFEGDDYVVVSDFVVYVFVNFSYRLLG